MADEKRPSKILAAIWVVVMTTVFSCFLVLTIAQFREMLELQEKLDKKRSEIDVIAARCNERNSLKRGENVCLILHVIITLLH